MEMKKDESKQVPLSELRKKLEGQTGEKYWRSFDELSQTQEFQAALQHEFPQEPSLWERSTTRRKFLQLMGSMIAMAGLAGCTRQPTEKIVPYVKAPEELIPGKPLYYATAISLGGFARGLLVESHMGRPTKIEGNPEHPDSLGAADIISQASVLSLYDPDRSQAITRAGVISTWDSFVSAMNGRLKAQKEKQGAGLRIVTPTVISPTLGYQLANILKKFPLAKWHQYSPINRDNEREGALQAFGEDVTPQYRIEKADVILSLDSDFLNVGAGSIRYARDFASRRKVRDGKNAKDTMNRLYAVESMPTTTGSMADHRLPMRAGDLETFAFAMAQKLGVSLNKKKLKLSKEASQWVEAVHKDLLAHRGKSLVIAGKEQSPVVHALAFLMNQALGNHGSTVSYTEPVEVKPENQIASLRDLVQDLERGAVDDLILLETNLVYKAPVDLHFSEALKKAKFRVHLGLYQDETARLCEWHIPQAHYLESWSDARAFDGTASTVQPLIHPLYNGKTAHEMISVLEDRPRMSSHDIVRQYWKSANPSLDSEKAWEKALHDGVIRGSEFKTKSVALRSDLNLSVESPSRGVKEIEVNFRPDPTIGDGDFANNGWLQELPKPLTLLTWDNAALLSPSTAEHFGVSNDDVIELTYLGRQINAPVWILPGHAPDSITLNLGYGRKRAGKVGSDIGFNAYELRDSIAPDFARGITIQKTNRKYHLVTTQDHHSMEDRHLVRTTDLDNYSHHPEFAQHMVHDPKPNETLYKPNEHLKGEYQWGMTIDLNSCIGCGACTVACQSENNIPIVGKEEVANGREMSWIRVDRYYKGDLDNPETYHQPVPCMHCENAPCEPVCPVGATVHSDEGLNEMTYNRCVGTRYCSNNCSYKVRRFNFYQYADQKTPTLQMKNNPDVTVRTRGIMEKCTYCVQRINTARIDSKKEDRSIRDGEIVTACQQTCPTQAIVFGDIKDPQSEVSKEKADSLNYGILTDLGTRPRTTYLARIKNPNPELKST